MGTLVDVNVKRVVARQTVWGEYTRHNEHCGEVMKVVLREADTGGEILALFKSKANLTGDIWVIHEK